MEEDKIFKIIDCINNIEDGYKKNYETASWNDDIKDYAEGYYMGARNALSNIRVQIFKNLGTYM